MPLRRDADAAVRICVWRRKVGDDNQKGAAWPLFDGGRMLKGRPLALAAYDPAVARVSFDAGNACSFSKMSTTGR